MDKYAIRHLQSGRIEPQLLQCKPEEAEVPDGYELVVYEQGVPEPYEAPVLTPHEEAMLNIRAFLAAIEDEMDKMDLT